MKKILIFISAFIISIIFFSCAANAEEAYENYGEFGDFCKQEIVAALPEDIKDALRQNDISPDNGGVLTADAGNLYDYVINSVTKEITKPLTMLAGLVGVAMLCALSESLRDSAGNGNSKAAGTFGIVAVLAGAGLITGFIAECVLRTSGVLTACGTFLLTFVPVFAGIMAVAGQITTASVFASVIVAAAQLFSIIMIALLTPLTGCILGFSVAGAINPDLKIDQFANVAKKVLTFVLGLMVVLFVGLLSVQSFVTASADSVTMKAAKFVVSGTVPIIGSAVGDALATVKGSLGVVRASTGTFGIIAAAAIVAPAMISALLYRFALIIAGFVCDAFGVSRLSALVKAGEQIVAIVFAMLTAFIVLAVVSIAMMLYMTGGVT